jgi:hypothetical protein
MYLQKMSEGASIRDREGLPGLPTDEKPAQDGSGEAGGIIHHLEWEHPSILF